MAHCGEEGTFCLIGLFCGRAGFLHFVEQAYILDGDHSLICEDLQDGNLLVRKRLGVAFTHANTANRFSFSQHRDEQGTFDGLCADIALRDLGQVLCMFHIRYVNNCTFQDCTCRQRTVPLKRGRV
jgi:hypothetical protein